MYFIVNSENLKIISHYKEKPNSKFDSALVVELDSIVITETTIDHEDYVSTTFSYTPDSVDLLDYKSGCATLLLESPIISNEITLANGLKFDDNQESLNYLQIKRATSNASEVVYDKYNNSETMTNAQLTTAVGVLASLIMQKDDEVKAKIMQINNAQSITEVQLIAGLLQERIVKLIVDVDGTQFDDVNQTTDETLNQVVMPVSGSLDLSKITWLNAKGVKSINGQSTSPQQIIDSNNVHTANVTFSADNPIVTGGVIADGSPVTVDMVVYY